MKRQEGSDMDVECGVKEHVWSGSNVERGYHCGVTIVERSICKRPVDKSRE